MMHLPKDIGALPGPVGDKNFPGELDADFDSVLGSVDASPIRTAPAPVMLAFRLAEPLLGAMPDGVKASLEHAVGSTAGFSRVRSTALNMILNLILYPAILTAFSVEVLGDGLFSQHTGGWIMLGVLIAAGEAAWRLREGVIHAKPAQRADVSRMLVRARARAAWRDSRPRWRCRPPHRAQSRLRRFRGHDA